MVSMSNRQVGQAIHREQRVDAGGTRKWATTPSRIHDTNHRIGLRVDPRKCEMVRTPTVPTPRLEEGGSRSQAIPTSMENPTSTWRNPQVQCCRRGRGTDDLSTV